MLTVDSILSKFSIKHFYYLYMAISHLRGRKWQEGLTKIIKQYILNLNMINSNIRINQERGNIVLGLLIGAVLALIPSYYFYTKYQQAQKLLKNPQQVSLEQTKSVVNMVGKLIALPTDETPSLATVQDKTKLKDQPFFKNAVNGDKLLIFVKAKKAILYRESNNKIIEVAPINIQKPAAGAATEPTKAPTPTVKK